ncbi:MAG: CoA transferase [Dehalococcoidia bacterium]|nr:CoA transferase [Dehalococcoidia bacterium]
MSIKPLSGIRVLDLTWVYAGPFATQILGDLGADIIKIEAAPVGDKTRIMPPFKNGYSGYFATLNRGKKSLALNLKNDKGRQLLLELAKHCDVLTENFAPRALEQLGLGYEHVKKANPRIIYASASGFGSYGPYSNRPCIDPVGQAMGGLMSLTGHPDRSPLKAGPGIADAIMGLYAVAGILSALRLRDMTGEGQRLEVAMMDSIFSVLEENVIKTSLEGVAPQRRGNLDPFGVPWDSFLTKDGRWVMVCAFSSPVFEELYRMIGRDDLVEKYKGDNIEGFLKRSADQEMLNSVFAQWVRENMTADDLESLFIAMDAPMGIIKDVKELLDDPHLKARNMVVDVDHPKLGKVKTFNLPIKFFGAAAGVEPGENPHDPGLGEHSDEILKSILGKTDAEIAALRSEKVIWI